jgi:hypothetical protein
VVPTFALIVEHGDENAHKLAITSAKKSLIKVDSNYKTGVSSKHKFISLFMCTYVLNPLMNVSYICLSIIQSHIVSSSPFNPEKNKDIEAPNSDNNYGTPHRPQPTASLVFEHQVVVASPPANAQLQQRHFQKESDDMDNIIQGMSEFEREFLSDSDSSSGSTSTPVPKSPSNSHKSRISHRSSKSTKRVTPYLDKLEEEGSVENSDSALMETTSFKVTSDV